MGPSWAFVAGWPVGALAGLALLDAPGLRELALCAGGGGLLLAALVWLLARRGGWNPERGRRLARAASAGLLAVPALSAALLGLAPGAAIGLALVIAAIAAAMAIAVRRVTPAASLPRHALRVVLALVVFDASLLVVGAVAASIPTVQPMLDDALGDAVLDADARVALGPERTCDPRAGRSQVLRESGAHPRILGDALWFDAPHQGRRQIHRMSLEGGEVACFTCDEPGNNRRPAPAPAGHAVVFDTDRHASLLHPINSELHAIASGRPVPTSASRRLTNRPLPDDRALYDPSGRGVVWSSGEGSGFVVRRAAITSGHGGVILTGERILAVGGRSWVTPIAWSADGRALVTGRGHPLRPLRGDALDAATGDRFDLGVDLAGAGAVAYTADGARMAVAATRPSGAQSLLPDGLGFVLGRLAAWRGVVRPRPGDTLVRTGPRDGSLEDLDLGDEADWGEPTGVALSPEGTFLVLGQRRPGDPAAERLLRVDLDCRAVTKADSGSPAIGHAANRAF